MITEIASFAQQHFPDLCRARPLDTHKGTFGTLGILAGGKNMVGAALLAARAALKQGTGRVHIGFSQENQPLEADPIQPELMLNTAGKLLGKDDITVWVAGCGMGLTPLAQNCLATLFNRYPNAPIVLDADALTLLSEHAFSLSHEKAPLVLTPHPSEAARLLGCTAADIQKDRQQAARQISAKYAAWTVLKGYQTVICTPASEITVNHSGNPGLSTAGTGDVLAGMIGACLAQGITAEQAIAGAVWLHGAAADYLVSQGIGPIGMTAGEVLEAARTVRNLITIQA
ncbi:NAD(P)H-hydrate dehydratase [Advenella sp. WQ 585]|uniref:ADP-dependent (S)-NAD(P)H-hydrate dehydratase n=1 Tax=Advenella mandrilli TaxID=2800330 RepID=A0ABS1E9G4_9BURK|nr:NAD(P)H-hydrate dehydratase [Advenella mandrilli]MBK1780051.1 NAD(P)H-hydrate dehydratase [Advenella mandrilli]